MNFHRIVRTDLHVEHFGISEILSATNPRKHSAGPSNVNLVCLLRGGEISTRSDPQAALGERSVLANAKLPQLLVGVVDPFVVGACAASSWVG
jgi:hypothetical protein